MFIKLLPFILLRSCFMDGKKSVLLVRNLPGLKSNMNKKFLRLGNMKNEGYSVNKLKVDSRQKFLFIVSFSCQNYAYSNLLCLHSHLEILNCNFDIV